MDRIDIILVALLLANFWLLTTSRIRAAIRIVAVQGAILGLLPLLATQGMPGVRAAAVAAASIALKGIIFPKFLLRALSTTNVRREEHPPVGYTASIAVGLVALGFSFWLAGRAPLPMPTQAPLALPVALTTILIGLFVIVSRRKALTQLLGYIVLENGIFAFGFALDIEAGFLVEMGILLDAFLAVAVMGVAILHIHRAYDAIDTGMLSQLKDWNP